MRRLQWMHVRELRLLAAAQLAVVIMVIFLRRMRGTRVGWCWEREKIDWQEARKFDCRLVRTIFIFCCPSSIRVVQAEGEN